MTIAEAAPAIDPHTLDDLTHDRAFMGHPKGLGYLAIVEGCERFSYYSMQTLLVLYMVKYLLLPAHIDGVAGLGWLRGGWYAGLSGQPLASAMFGDYTALVYLTPILGGLIADTFAGRRATLIAGGVVMAIGHFLMAFETTFLFALLALVIGVGLFKGNIAGQVGELYRPGDQRRAMAFQIFYIAINVSVIVAPLVSGTLGEEVGWHWGFGCAGVVMVVGLAIYLAAAPYLPPEPGRKPGARGARPPAFARADWPRMIAILLLVPVLTLGLITNQEIFNAYLVWADGHFARALFGFAFPTSWMITIDATFSFAMLVGVAGFWKWYGARFAEPDELGKLLIGSVFGIMGGLCLVAAAAGGSGGGRIALFWPLMFHLLNSIGFANVLPVSLALFSRLAPRRMAAFTIGLYYLAFFAANKAVGVIGQWYATMDTMRFWLLHVACATASLIGFAAFKVLLAARLMGDDRGGGPVPA